MKVRNYISKQQCALKVIATNNQETDSRNLQELLILSRLDHPNILPIYGFDKTIQKAKFGNQFILKILMPIVKTTLE